MSNTEADQVVAILRAINIVVTNADGRVLLIERTHAPHRGLWALPGGLVDPCGTSRAAAVRELAEEIGVRASEDELTYIGVWDAPGRDPRGRYVTSAYRIEASEGTDIETGDAAVRAEWWPPTDLPPMALDHADIIRIGTAT